MAERALIVSSSAKELSLTEQLLRSSGCRKISAASSGSEARRIIGMNKFSIVVIDAPLSDEFGHELSIRISESSTAVVTLLCKNDIADDISEKLSEHGVCIIPKPLNKLAFQKSLKLLQAKRSRMLGLKKETDSLLAKIDEMRLINRAKCTLMLYLKFTEPQAHKYIEKQAMNTRRTRRDVAVKILSDYER